MCATHVLLCHATMDIQHLLRHAIDGKMSFPDLVSTLRAMLRSRPMSLDDLDFCIIELTAMRDAADRILTNRQSITLRKARSDLARLIDSFKLVRANAIARSIPDGIGRGDFE